MTFQSYHTIALVLVLVGFLMGSKESWVIILLILETSKVLVLG